MKRQFYTCMAHIIIIITITVTVTITIIIIIITIITIIMILFLLTHWRLNEIACNPPLIPWHFLEYFKANKSTKINYMRSSHIHKVRFWDIIYLKLNKWRVKILKNINKKNSTWCVKLMRKQEIILFLYRATKCPTEAEKIDFVEMRFFFIVYFIDKNILQYCNKLKNQCKKEGCYNW